MRGALIVGIDHYETKPLNGCVNDASNFSNVLKRDDFQKRNFDYDLVISNDKNNIISRSLLLEKISSLFSTNSEIALCYFSGHGTENDLGGYIVTQDGDKISLHEIIDLANNSIASDRAIILDSCFSGHLGNLPSTEQIKANNNRALISEGVSILTASRANQKAYEDGEGGIFTSLIVDALKGGAADILGKVTIPSVYAYVDQALGFFQQRPLFKSHVSTLISIRDCKPSVSLEIIHMIPVYFHDKDFLYPLDPTYEPTHKECIPENALILSHLQKLRNARLLTPIDEEHMYDVAIRSKKCCLTPEGKYYWYLVKNEKI